MDVATQLLAEMSVPEADVRRVPMSWSEFEALPDELRAEWVDGEAFVSPRPSWFHGVVVVRLAAILSAAFPDLLLMTESGVWLPGRRLRGPDLTLVAAAPDSTFVEEPPILVLEVLSPSTRAEDLDRKVPEYAGAGIAQLWVVDPDARTIDVHRNVDGAWELLLHLDDQHPTGEVPVGGHGVVPLALTTILLR